MLTDKTKLTSPTEHVEHGSYSDELPIFRVIKTKHTPSWTRMTEGSAMLEVRTHGDGNAPLSIDCRETNAETCRSRETMIELSPIAAKELLTFLQQYYT